MYGRHDLARIATELDNKTEEEVRRYAQVFWARLEEISDWQKLLKRIQDGEAVLQRRRELEQVRHADAGTERGRAAQRLTDRQTDRYRHLC